VSRRRELEAGCTGRYHWPTRSLFERDGRRCNLDIICSNRGFFFRRLLSLPGWSFKAGFRREEGESYFND
jgi:hypothetical protein